MPRIVRAVSRARAERQRRIMDLLEDAGPHGMTWHEIGLSEGWHHGQTSGALSNLHKDGLISRLSERRGKSMIYVRNKYVAGRELSPYKSNKSLAEENEALRQEIERLQGENDRLRRDNYSLGLAKHGSGPHACSSGFYPCWCEESRLAGS